jgi:hypothetical protein
MWVVLYAGKGHKLTLNWGWLSTGAQYIFQQKHHIDTILFCTSKFILFSLPSYFQRQKQKIYIRFLLNLIHLGNIKTLKIHSIENVYQTDRLRFFPDCSEWGSNHRTQIYRSAFFSTASCRFYQSDAYLFSIFVSLLSRSKNTVNKWKHFSDDLWNDFNEKERKMCMKRVWWRR